MDVRLNSEDRTISSPAVTYEGKKLIDLESLIPFNFNSIQFNFKQKSNLLARINARNRISLDLNHLDQNCNLPNASVRNKETVFPLPPMTSTLELLPLDIPIPTWIIYNPWTYLLPLYFCQTLALMKNCRLGT